MANNEIKTNAEIYREQRKARLAKAAKKKKSRKGGKVLAIITKIILIVLVFALALYFVGSLFLNVFGTPQRLIVASTYDDAKISVAEINYYYRSLYQQTITTSQQLDQAYSGYGTSSYFNTSLDPAEQDYIGTDAPEEVKTWADYFEYMAPVKAHLMNSLYNEAMENKFELTEEQQEEMDTNIEEFMTSIEDYAKTAEFSVDNYIARSYGEGLNKELYLELLEKDLIVEYYLASVQEKYAEDVTDEDINAYYEENKDTIDIASIRSFPVSYAEATEDSTDPVYTKAEAKKRAEEFVAKVTDEASFIAATKEFAAPSMAETYEDESVSLDENISKADLSALSEDIGNWIFDSERKINDVKIFDLEDQESYYIAFIVEPADKDTRATSADIRHLLVQAETTDADGNALDEATTEKNFKEAKAEAEKLLAEWKKGEATEETFTALVKEHTDDTASAETGGLYEDVADDGTYVQEFTDWALEPHKVGDTGIVKTSYGYHIMYFVGADKTQQWESSISTTIADEAYSAYLEEHYNKAMEKKPDLNEKILNFFVDRNAENITEIMMSSASTSSSSLTY